jgi:hypothetical protein
MFTWMKSLTTWLAKQVIGVPLKWFATALAYVVGVWWRIEVLILGTLFAFLIGLLTPLLQDVFALVQSFYSWLIDFGYGIFRDVLQSALNTVPTLTQPTITSISNYIDAANHWVPIDSAVTVGIGIFTYWMTLGAFFMVKRIFPTMGK